MYYVIHTSLPPHQPRPTRMRAPLGRPAPAVAPVAVRMALPAWELQLDEVRHMYLILAEQNGLLCDMATNGAIHLMSDAAAQRIVRT